jgi:hypothetical protein
MLAKAQRRKEIQAKNFHDFAIPDKSGQVLREKLPQ